jgi:hypothetical protein
LPSNLTAPRFPGTVAPLWESLVHGGGLQSYARIDAAQHACESSAMAAAYEGALGKNNRGGNNHANQSTSDLWLLHRINHQCLWVRDLRR